MSKICTKCKTLKNLGSFGRRAAKRDGFRSQCKDCDAIDTYRYNTENKEKVKNKRIAKRGVLSVYAKKYRTENPDKIRIAKTKSVKKRREMSPAYRMECNLRRRLKKVLEGKNRSQKSFELIGASPEAVMDHLESYFHRMKPNKFTGEIPTRNSFGRTGLHVDHIKPCSSFDLTNPEQQKQCFHYTNLQPLWWYDNLKKGDK